MSDNPSRGSVGCGCHDSERHLCRAVPGWARKPEDHACTRLRESEMAALCRPGRSSLTAPTSCRAWSATEATRSNASTAAPT